MSDEIEKIIDRVEKFMEKSFSAETNTVDGDEELLYIDGTHGCFPDPNWQERPEGEYGLLNCVPDLDRPRDYLKDKVIEGRNIGQEVADWERGIASAPYLVTYLPVGSQEEANVVRRKKIHERFSSRNKLYDIIVG